MVFWFVDERERRVLSMGIAGFMEFYWEAQTA